MTLEEFKQKIFSPLVWGNLLAMAVVVLAILIGLWFWLAKYTQHGIEVEVPNVTTQMYSDGCYLLEAEKLIPVVSDSTYDRSLPQEADCF